MMILGTQLFLTGFLGELIVRNSSRRNEYEIEMETGGGETPAATNEK